MKVEWQNGREHMERCKTETKIITPPVAGISADKETSQGTVTSLTVSGQQSNHPCNLSKAWPQNTAILLQMRVGGFQGSQVPRCILAQFYTVWCMMVVCSIHMYTLVYSASTSNWVCSKTHVESILERTLLQDIYTRSSRNCALMYNEKTYAAIHYVHTCVQLTQTPA